MHKSPLSYCFYTHSSWYWFHILTRALGLPIMSMSMSMLIWVPHEGMTRNPLSITDIQCYSCFWCALIRKHGWMRLWDSALNHGVNSIRAGIAILICYHFCVDKSCISLQILRKMRSCCIKIKHTLLASSEWEEEVFEVDFGSCKMCLPTSAWNDSSLFKRILLRVQYSGR